MLRIEKPLSCVWASLFLAKGKLHPNLSVCMLTYTNANLLKLILLQLVLTLYMLADKMKNCLPSLPPPLGWVQTLCLKYINTFCLSSNKISMKLDSSELVSKYHQIMSLYFFRFMAAFDINLYSSEFWFHIDRLTVFLSVELDHCRHSGCSLT